MVRRAIWKEAGMGDGFLRVACLERRLGRELQPADFIDAPCNDPRNPWATPTLAARLRGKVRRRRT